MNQIDNLNVISLNTSSLYTTTSTSNHSVVDHLDVPNALFRKKVSFGSHTFSAEQLGQLLSYLLTQHPEISI